MTAVFYNDSLSNDSELIEDEGLAAIESSGYTGFDFSSLVPLSFPLPDIETDQTVQPATTPSPLSSPPRQKQQSAIFSCIFRPPRASTPDSNKPTQDTESESENTEPENEHGTIPANCMSKDSVSLELLRQHAPKMYQQFHQYCATQFSLENLMAWEALGDAYLLTDRPQLVQSILRIQEIHFLPTSSFPLGCFDAFPLMNRLCAQMQTLDIPNIQKSIKNIRYLIESESLQDPLVRWVQLL